ncbi:unnamed protein product, partial [Rotaria magnacalcarata]
MLNINTQKQFNTIINKQMTVANSRIVRSYAGIITFDTVSVMDIAA